MSGIMAPLLDKAEQRKKESKKEIWRADRLCLETREEKMAGMMVFTAVMAGSDLEISSWFIGHGPCTLSMSTSRVQHRSSTSVSSMRRMFRGDSHCGCGYPREEVKHHDTVKWPAAKAVNSDFRNATIERERDCHPAAHG